MKHLNPELEKLEQRIAPDLVDLDGDVDLDIDMSSSIDLSGDVSVDVG